MQRDLPTGTVTFLFTDVEASTQLVKRLRDRYPEVLSQHQRLLREAFERYGGYEVDTQGDAFFVAFGSARDAVLAAVEGQRALAEFAWPEGVSVKVRTGIHTGQAAPSEGRYTGVAVHRAARVSAAGHGGQILVSQTTHNLLEDEEEEIPGVALRDLGEHRLKDLDRPVRLYQVEVVGLERHFPPLRTEAPSPVAEPAARPVRRRTILAGALAGVIAAAVAIPIFALGGSSGGALGELEGNAVGVLELGSGGLDSAVEMPTAPTAVAAGDGGIWVASESANTVTLIDPKTNTIRDTVRVGDAPGAIAVGGGTVWTANSLGGEVTRISTAPPYDVVGTIRVGNGPSGVAFGEGRAWVTIANDHAIAKITPRSGEFETFPAGEDPGAVAVGAGAVWVAGRSSGTVKKLDPRTGAELKTINVGEGPAGIAVGLGSVWVANGLDGTVSRIDGESGDVVDTIEVGRGASGIAVAAGHVWVANESARSLSRLDPATGRAETIAAREQPTAVADGGGFLYVAVRAAGGHNGGTLRVSQPAERLPTTLELGDNAEYASNTNDGLVAFRRVGGQRGAQLVPDLASSMPAVSEDGRTYTFQLRLGIRYSDGRLVKPSDVRTTFERLFTLGPKLRPLGEGVQYYGAIAGAETCAASPARCDLSKGIVTDDAGSIVTFRLARPDPDFLYKLALPYVFVVPSGTPARVARKPLPATGPYRVAGFVPRRYLRLARNPRFDEWSEEAQPGGFPDEIVVEGVKTQEEAVRLVERAEADLTPGPLGVTDDPLTVDPRFHSQLHVNPAAFIVFLAFNVHRPPFDASNARRAVSYVIDRRKLAQLWRGPEGARPTCQFLPQNFPAYRSYCPYTVDLRRAKQLVGRTGTRGDGIELRWTPVYGDRVRDHVVSDLEALGYDVTVREIADPARHFDALASPNATWNVAPTHWIAAYPAPSDFLVSLLSCSSPTNYGGYCDRRFDRDMKRALALQRSDPDRSNRIWAELDRRVTDAVPLAPVWSPTSLHFVSKRVGNYQYNPQHGVLVSRLWVR